MLSASWPSIVGLLPVVRRSRSPPPAMISPWLIGGFKSEGSRIAPHRKRLRTTNGLERLNQEIKRRTNVARIFPSEKACLRLVTARPWRRVRSGSPVKGHLDMELLEVMGEAQETRGTTKEV